MPTCPFSSSPPCGGDWGQVMNRNVLYAVIAILAVVAAVLAYQAYERQQHSLRIEVGPNGIKVDPPAK